MKKLGDRGEQEMVISTVFQSLTIALTLNEHA